IEQTYKGESLNPNESRTGRRHGGIAQVREEISYQLVEAYELAPVGVSGQQGSLPLPFPK
ncbi:MAG: hypothetical protein DRH10_06595, partial [Deltaproteobacteria bacterium]